MSRQLKSIVIITEQKAAMTKFEFDGYNNKFNVNNNKIWKWLWLFHLVSIPKWSLQISDIN